MLDKLQLVVLMHLIAKDFPGLRLSPHGVKEEWDRWHRRIGYYSYSNINSGSLLIYALSAIKCGQVLDRLIREVVIADPDLGPIYALKADISDGFYRISLRPADAPNICLFFLSDGQGEELVAIPITLSMVCKNYPPISCKATLIVSDLEKSDLRYNKPSRPHNIDNRVEAVFIAGSQPLHPARGSGPNFATFSNPVYCYFFVL